MGGVLRHFPEYRLELTVFSGAVTDDQMLEVFHKLDHDANWLAVFARSADVSGVDVACFPALKRALNESEPSGAEPKLSALVNLSAPSELFVRFWSRYASSGARPSRRRTIFSSIEAACRWLGLPPEAAAKLAGAAAGAEAEAEAEAGMPAGPAEAAENRRKLLKAASRIFRERGYEAMDLPEIVAAAGLTGRGLDGLLESKDDLVVHALLDAMGDVEAIPGDVAEYAAGYLSPAHRRDVAGGCIMAALAAETLRQSPEARAAMTSGLMWHIERLSQRVPGEDAAGRRRAAIRAWSAMIGALILARVSDDEALSQEVLEDARTWIADPAIAAAKTAVPAVHAG